MRFIFKVLLGFILFNAMLVLFSGIFNQTNMGTDVSTIYDSYGNINQGTIVSMIATGGSIFGAIVVGGIAASLFINNFPTGLFIGAGALISLFFGLWAGLTNPLSSLASEYTYVDQIYNIFIIVFGIIVALSIIEIFTGRGDMDAT